MSLGPQNFNCIQGDSKMIWNGSLGVLLELTSYFVVLFMFHFIQPQSRNQWMWFSPCESCWCHVFLWSTLEGKNGVQIIGYNVVVVGSLSFIYNVHCTCDKHDLYSNIIFFFLPVGKPYLQHKPLVYVLFCNARLKFRGFQEPKEEFVNNLWGEHKG